MSRIVLLAAVSLSLCCGSSEGGVDIRHRWVYVQTNLLVDKNADDLIALMERAARAKYNGVMLADYKFNLLGQMEPRYFANLDRVKAAAGRLKLDLVPSLFPIGYSGGVLGHDPNLAAGLPVRDAPFVVRGGRLAPDDPLVLVNGDFEQLGAGRNAERFAGWDWQDPAVQADRTVVRSGRVALRMRDIGTVDPQHGHGRIVQTLSVQPFRCYHLSVWIKTESFETPGQARVQVLTEGQPSSLNYQNLGVKRTQDWTQHHVCFNTLTHTRVRVYLGVWGGKGGTIWWDDARLEPAGFFSVLRRDGCPLKIASVDGRTVYEEGRDFARVVDPRLGHAGFSIWHAGPAPAVPPGSRLREGDRVRASYYVPAVVHDSQVACELTEPKLYELLADQARRVHAAFGDSAAGWMMSHDEVRVGGWDAIAEAKGWTAGQWLADNVRRCQAIARQVRPGVPLYVWSDMFDPTHNARDNYYLVKTTWAASWEGLDKDTVIVNWYFGNREKGLPWFASRGHRQILAGYYDGRPEQIVEWLRSADKVDGVIGVMYTTWQRKYDDLERFSEQVDRCLAGRATP